MSRKGQTSIRLPKTLLDELNNSSENRRNGPKIRTSRKELRKNGRVEIKKRKADHFASAHSNRNERTTGEEHIDVPEPKRHKTNGPTYSSTQTKDKSKSKTPLEKLVEHSERPDIPKISRSQQEEHEDSYISYLESKLGWRRSGSKTTSYGSGLGDDGLDDLLDDLDRFEPSITSNLRLSEDEESQEEDSEEDVSEEESSSEDSLGDEGEEWKGFDVPPEASDATANLTVAVSQESSSNTGSRYVPPHLRKSSDNDSKNNEVLTKLNKQLKGLLNRLSEQNISTILDNIEEIYQKNRRNDVTSVITTLIIDGISSHSTHLESYVVLYAALVASLHRLIGVEFVAFFVQNIISSYEKHLEDVIPSGDVDGASEELHGKQASNLIVLLSELYNFQVVACVLIYDVIRGLLSQPQLTEYNIELLLKITRSSGLQLRHDDPSALRDIIQMVHSKISDQKESMSSRTNFMIETLTNLKNNKLKKAIGGGAGGSGGQEAVERLKKFLAALSKKRQVMSHEPLRITLEDLHSAEIKGKWWLVGAAWSGDPLVDNRDRFEAQGVSHTTHSGTEDKLMKLAKKHGMNTDIRRSIFVVIMSSEDYVDACERLGQLKLTEVQQREIVRVLLHCCGNEKTYNPYYTLICQHLCRTSHSYRITLQFCMWDFLRELGESNVGGMEILKRRQEEGGNDSGVDGGAVGRTKMRNLAKAYAWWISKDSCTLAIFKPVDFTILKTQSRDFFKLLLFEIFVNSQLSTPALASNTASLLATSTRNRASLEEIFIKAARIEQLSVGLLYFLLQSFGKETQAQPNEFLGWAVEIVKDTLRTGVYVPNL